MAEIKLFRPQRLTDNPDGGGLATATEVVDGEVNNLFDDISRIDRVNGELSLRKTFVIADTEDTELFSDLHAIVQAPPLDPRVSSVLFRTTTGWGDEREDAQNYVERYLDPSVITRMIPYDRQLEGQRTILVFQRPELSLPEIGEVYALVDETAGAQEYFRVQDVDHDVQVFTDRDGDFSVRVITITVSQPLSQEFLGSQPNRFFTADADRSLIRKTIASDAARYRGVVRLARDASPGDLSVRVESIFAQLVPAATSEVAVVDTPPDGVVALLPASEDKLWFTDTSLRSWSFPTAVFPGSLRSDGAHFWVDDGTGKLRDASISGPVVGKIDYARGRIELESSPGAVNISYTPAALVSKSALTDQIPVTIGNRGYVYVKTLQPVPAPGTLVVAFRAQGRWYVLQDDGTGALRGESGVGVGNLNFATGTVSVSLGAQPDAGSSIIFSWGTRAEYEIRTGDLAIEPPVVRIQLGAGNCEPGTLEITWEAGGNVQTAVADASGAITGDAVGRVVHATGLVEFRPDLLPDSNALYSCEYEAGSTQEEVFTPTASGGSVVIAATAGPLRPGSVEIEFMAFAEISQTATGSAPIVLRDNGSGGLVDDKGAAVAGGSVVYSTGVVTFPTTYVRPLAVLERADYGGVLPSRVVDPSTSQFVLKRFDLRIPAWMKTADSLTGFLNGTAVVLKYKADVATDSPVSEQHEPGPIVLKLLPRVRNSVVPGGLVFWLGSRQYFDRQGTLYYDIDLSTGAGTVGGSIDYSTGEAQLTSYPGGALPTLEVGALLTEVAPLPMYVVHGRTPGSPLRPGTFQIRANRASDGALITATADANGNISSADMHGVVDSTTGVFTVAFGAYVLDSSLSPEDRAEDWYDPANVDGEGYIWRPREALPGTVRFNCVIQVALPMDPAIIKVNPVRLPMDGRVPVIRPGDTLVIHEPLPFTLPDDLEAGQVVTLARDQLASVAVYDQKGLGVPSSMFEANLAAGTLSMADPLDLTGWEEPLVAIHSVEDMALCLDAQITGEVTFGQPLSRGYSADAALVSSALILGDAQARYERLFAQNTWTGEWSDDRIGDAPTGGAQYNDALWPLVVKNAHTITERWRLQFTSGTDFEIIGERLGNIGTGDTISGAAPINPATGQPYIEIEGAGFGGGWSYGNVIRFNTIAAGGPIWVARTVLSGPATNEDDRIRLQLRWDKD